MSNPNFPTNPGYNIYVGARYVPIFSGEWDATKRYENLEIVSYQGIQYTSRSYVPIGVPPTNETYWVKSADFNPEFDALEKRVENHEGRITQNEEAIKALQDGAGTGPDVDQLKQDVSALQQSQATQDTEIENLETVQGNLSTQISALETELDDTQVAQDTKITALETSQTAQDGKITVLETTQTAQDGKITALETSQTAQDGKITALETSQTTQDAEIAALKEENATQQDSIDALKAASGDLPTELEKIFAKDREQDNALNSLNEAQTELQNQLSALEDGTVELPYVKNVNGSVKGHIAYMNNPDTGDAVVGGRVEGTADSLMLHGGGPELPTHVTIGAEQVSFDKPISVNGGVAHADATADTQSATLGQVKTLVTGASGSATEALAKANEAKQAADAAQNTADSANTAAQTAQRDANAAHTEAGAAQTTANQAVANQANYLPLSGEPYMIGPLRLSKTNDNELIFTQHGDQSISRLFFWRNQDNSDIVLGSNGRIEDGGQQVSITGVSEPIYQSDVANKYYVDANDNTLLKLEGSRQMTGPLRLANTNASIIFYPSGNDHSIKRIFVYDQGDGLFSMGLANNNQELPAALTFSGISNPIYGSDVANKAYVDSAVAGAGGSNLQLKFLNLRADLYNNDVASGYITLAGYGIVNNLGRGIYNLVGIRTNPIPISANERIMASITNMPENGAICSAFMGCQNNVNVQFACTRFASNVVSVTSLTTATGVQLRVGVSIMVS